MVKSVAVMVVVALLSVHALGADREGHQGGEYEVLGYMWHRTSRPPLVPVWHVVETYVVRERCEERRRGVVQGCTRFDRMSYGLCDVYASQSELDTPDWIRWHELLHCAGWDHE